MFGVICYSILLTVSVCFGSLGTCMASSSISNGTDTHGTGTSAPVLNRLSNGSSSCSPTLSLDHDGGFGHEFVEPVDPKYECAVCLLVLCNPIQTHCGHRFCRTCIKKWLQQDRYQLCPVCKSKLDEKQMFPDNFAKREILCLEVKCVNASQGCSIVAQLKNINEHLTECDFSLKPCPNHCASILLKCELYKHVQTECPLRLVDCKMCGKSVQQCKMEDHENCDCEEATVSCIHCCKSLLRKELDSHMEEECLKVPVPCTFHSFGCETHVPRDQQAVHLESAIQEHLKLVTFAVARLFSHLRIPVKVYDVKNPVPLSFLPKSDVYSTDVLSKSVLSGSVLESVESQTCTTTSGYNSKQTSDLIASVLELPSSLTSTYSYSNMMVSSSQASKQSWLSGPNSLSLSDVLSSGGSTVLSSEGASHSRSNTQPSQSQPQGADRDSYAHKDTVAALQQEITNLTSRINSQDEGLAQQQQLILELQRQNDLLHGSARMWQDKAKVLETQIADQEARYCNGNKLWRISDYWQKKGEACRGRNTVLHSPGFYTSFYGYKVCIRINLNGVESALGTHLSLFIHFLQGRFDDILNWPFRGSITLSILDQSDSACKQHITETLIANPALAAFQRPATPRNLKGFGYIQFVPVELLEGPGSGFIKDNSIVIQAEVKSE